MLPPLTSIVVFVAAFLRIFYYHPDAYNFFGTYRCAFFVPQVPLLRVFLTLVAAAMVV